jgi:hypothetical protein
VKKKKKEQIANRLASISSSKANLGDVRIPEYKASGKPQRAKREPVFRPGKLYLTKTHHVRCVIRNVSETGAYVHMESLEPLPEIVVLRFEQIGTVKKCKVVWQNEIEVGLEFVKPAAGDAAES